MVEKKVKICDRCDKHIPLGKCAVCEDDLCWKCASVLIVDKGTTEVRFRFDEFSAEEEADKLIVSKELSDSLGNARASLDGEQHPKSAVLVEVFCETCVRKVIENVDIEGDFMKVIKEKIMVDSI